MSTPTISKKQQRHSLSAKKTPVKGLRNVLAQPYDSYWPVIDTNKSPILENLLKRLIPPLKRPSPTIPWSQLRHMKKEERAQAKKEAVLKEGEVPNPELQNSVVMGINAVTRSLEKSNICCVLLDSNIEPPFLIRHIIMMAQNKKIPMLLVPFLKSVTANTIGYESAAFALKNIVAESSEHHFYELYAKILDALKDIPEPKNTLQLFKDSEADENQQCEDVEMSTQCKPSSNAAESNKFTLSTNVYKYRSSCKERAFIPPSVVQEPATEKTECTDFISMSNYESDTNDNDGEISEHASINGRYVNIPKNKDIKYETDESNITAQQNDSGMDVEMNNSNKSDNRKKHVKYLSLKVKRIQGNSNRVKATKLSKRKRKELKNM